MRIYFSATITDNDDLRDVYNETIKHLSEHGHKVFEYGSHKLSPQDILTQDDTMMSSVYKELDKFMRSADVYIADISLPSVGIGYEISQAISLKKPVLALIHDNSEFQPLATIKGNQSKYLTHRAYNKGNLGEIITTFIDEAKRKLDTKFILILPPELEHYLKWSAKTNKLHKAEVLRGALSEKINKDKNYQEYMKTLDS